MSNDVEKVIKNTWFHNHVAEYDKINDRISVLDWRRPKTCIYGIRYVFDGSKLYISGDVGEAIFNLTWNGTPKSFENIYLDYFHSKLVAYRDSKYEFDSDEAIKELNEQMKILKEENDYKDNEIEVYYKLINAANSCTNVKDWAFEVNELFDELQKIDNDAWEWIYGIGNVIPIKVRAYLIGLKMANQQL